MIVLPLKDVCAPLKEVWTCLIIKIIETKKERRVEHYGIRSGKGSKKENPKWKGILFAKISVNNIDILTNSHNLNFQNYYYLKWVGYNNRHNTWEPEENLNCDDLLLDFNKSRAIKVHGVAKKEGQVLYLIQFCDENEPIFKDRAQANIWSKDLLKFLIAQISFDGFEQEVVDVTRDKVLSAEEIPSEEVPEIICEYIYVQLSIFTLLLGNGFFCINFLARLTAPSKLQTLNTNIFLSDATDMTGDIFFCLKFTDGLFFAPVTYVTEKWADLAVDYLESHLT